MKFTAVVRDAKYKKGDLVRIYIGKQHDVPLVVYVHSYVHSGRFTLIDGKVETNTYVPYGECVYVLVAQEDVICDAGKEWIYKRQILVLDAIEIDTEWKTELVTDWPHPIEPSATEEYIAEKFNKNKETN